MNIVLAEDDGMGIGRPPVGMALATGQAVLALLWEPMHTSPKSWVDATGTVQGVYLLVFEPLDTDYGFTASDDPQIGIGVGWWEPNEGDGSGAWYDGQQVIHPTHWMPLPAAPTLARCARG